MRFVSWSGVGVALCLCAAAQATPTLQFDVNSIGVQATNGAGTATAFGGLAHTGAINFSMQNSSVLAGMFAQLTTAGPWVNQNFGGSLSGITGSIVLDQGIVQGGSITVSVNGGADSYTCSVVSSVGRVKQAAGGGYYVQGLTFQGAFTDAQFGNVDVSQWFAANGALFGSFMEFSFNPDANGGGFADMDIFVDGSVPLPPAEWAGLATMAGLVAVRWVRRRK